MRRLRNEEVNIKIKLAALWAALMNCYIYADYFQLYVPKVTADLVNGDNLLDSPAKLFAAALLLAVPACMIFLSVLLPPRINRLLNLIFGAFYTILMVFIGGSSVSTWEAFYVFFALLESIITIIIFRLAWRWPEDQS